MGGKTLSYHIRGRAGALIFQDDSVLLIEFNDENGLHDNLPAGGIVRNGTVDEYI